jgi:CubicO group peptidase (beta-lactamase class C family)
MKTRTFVSCIIALAILLTLTLGEISYAEYWPTRKWRTASPEKQGIDSNQLSKIDTIIQNEMKSLSSLLIVRNGYIVYEKYYTGDETKLRSIRSVTKVITSSVIGIILDQGSLKSIDQKIFTFLPELLSETTDLRAKDITIRHLLTMTAGFGPNDTGLTNVNQIKLMLSLPLKSKPGKEFAYNSTCSNLESMIISSITSQTASEIAKKHIFDPLGITNFRWDDADGYTVGGKGLALTTRDMAKIGYLYLKDGRWGKQQILPADWIIESTNIHVDLPDSKLYGFSDYGFHWSIHSANGHFAYFAWGSGGQHIYVVPDSSLIVVITSNAVIDSVAPLALIKNQIVPIIIKK